MPMHPRSSTLMPCVFAAAFFAAVVSQGVSAQPAAQPATVDRSHFNAFGGKPGLQKLNVDLLNRAKSDPRLTAAFKDSNLARVAEQLTDQFCQVLGGPCSYRGPDMKAAHQNMDVTAAQFNALVELLQEAMKAQGIPFGAQNALLAKLAPMHRDIVAR